MATRVGFIGLGRMGRPMAENVLKGGFELTVYDQQPKTLEALKSLGAHVAASPGALAEKTDVILLAVATGEQVESLVLGAGGLLGGAQPGAVIAIHTTITPTLARRLGEVAAAKGVGVLDAQMSGGPTGASARNLYFMVGGDRALLERCRPVFETTASNIFHMGGLGTGGATKVVQEIITCVTVLAAGEGMQLAERAGVDLDALAQVMQLSVGRSYIAEHWREMVQSMDTRTVEHFCQGMRPGLNLAHELGIPVPGAALAQELIAQHLNRR